MGAATDRVAFYCCLYCCLLPLQLPVAFVQCGGIGGSYISWKVRLIVWLLSSAMVKFMNIGRCFSALYHGQLYEYRKLFFSRILLACLYRLLTSVDKRGTSVDKRGAIEQNQGAGFAMLAMQEGALWNTFLWLHPEKLHKDLIPSKTRLELL